MTETQDEFDELPRPILERLEARDRAVSIATPRADETVLRLAAAQFAARRPASALTRTATVGMPTGQASRTGARARAGTRVSRGPRRWALPLAVAATVLIAVSAVLVLDPGRDVPTATTRLADDIDGSGQVDILDAFALARARDRGPIDQARIDALAARVVSLSAERPL